MDDLKYNTQGPFTSEHQIFHVSSRTSSYGREVEEKKGLQWKNIKLMWFTQCQNVLMRKTPRVRKLKETADESGKF